MSLLQPIRGSVPLDADSPEAMAEATRRLCEGLLAHNRLRAEMIVAARFVATGADASPTETAAPIETARSLGWKGIPLFFSRSAGPTASLAVEAWVRLVRKRKLRRLELS